MNRIDETFRLIAEVALRRRVSLGEKLTDETLEQIETGLISWVVTVGLEGVLVRRLTRHSFMDVEPQGGEMIEKLEAAAAEFVEALKAVPDAAKAVKVIMVDQQGGSA